MARGTVYYKSSGVYYKSRESAAYLGVSAEELTELTKDGKIEVYHGSEYRPLRRWRKDHLQALLIELNPGINPEELIVAAIMRIKDKFFKYSPSHSDRILKVAEARERNRKLLKKDLSVLKTSKKQPSIATQQRIHDNQESLKKLRSNLLGEGAE